MKKESVEFSVGLFVLVCFACIGFMTVRLGKVDFFNKDEYTLKAKFRNATGLQKGANVEIAGIVIGKVSAVELDIKDQIALATLQINKKYELDEEIIASIKTSGLIGDKYIKISPGAGEEILSDGDFIAETESSVDIEDLISKYVFGGVK